MSTPAGFVGRQSELRILGERLAAAQTGQPQVVYVEGEAGGGKSTLLSRQGRGKVVNRGCDLRCRNDD
jgi:predicted ATPase